MVECFTAFDADDFALMDSIAPGTPDVIRGNGYSEEERAIMSQLETTPCFPEINQICRLTAHSMLLTAQEIGKLFMLSTAFRNDSEQGEELWFAACFSLSNQVGLYAPSMSITSAKQLFFEHIWPARRRWNSLNISDEVRLKQDFQIKVAVRFRPGKTSTGSLFLPLHQRLKMMKKGETIGDREPPEFCDPLMHTLMRDPVLLPSSGKIMDRRVIERHLRTNRTDPFTGKFLSPTKLQPHRDLRLRIQDWESSRGKVSSQSEEMRVSSEAVGFLHPAHTHTHTHIHTLSHSITQPHNRHTHKTHIHILTHTSTHSLVAPVQYTHLASTLKHTHAHTRTHILAHTPIPVHTQVSQLVDAGGELTPEVIAALLEAEGVYSVLCALCCVLGAVCCVLCALCCVLCAVCCVLCAVCSVLCALCSVLCALLCSVLYVFCSASLCSVLCGGSVALWLLCLILLLCALLLCLLPAVLFLSFGLCCLPVFSCALLFCSALLV
jgi:hypothetical protein